MGDVGAGERATLAQADVVGCIGHLNNSTSSGVGRSGNATVRARSGACRLRRRCRSALF